MVLIQQRVSDQLAPKSNGVKEHTHYSLLFTNTVAKYSGATCNVILQKTLKDCLGNIALNSVNRMLYMYNQTVVTPKGQCSLPQTNDKNGKSYMASFMVLNGECTSLFGSETIQQMELIKAQFENILYVNGSPGMELACSKTKEEIQKEFANVFHGTGKLQGRYHLEINDNTVLLVHPPLRYLWH